MQIDPMHIDPMHIDIVSGVLLLGPAGVLAGSGARLLLARMRRGARVRAPVCELAVGGLWALVGAGWGAAAAHPRWHLGWRPEWLPVLLALAWLGVAAGVVDLRHRRLPDALTLPAALVAPLVVLPLGLGAAGRGLLAGLAGVAAYGALHVLAPAALGAGDVKLAASLGTALGAASWPAVAAGAVLAALLTAVLACGVVAAAVVATGRGARASPVPHGPSMLAAAWLVTAGVATGVG